MKNEIISKNLLEIIFEKFLLFFGALYLILQIIDYGYWLWGK
jgi:hypothetical protein